MIQMTTGTETHPEAVEVGASAGLRGKHDRTTVRVGFVEDDFVPEKGLRYMPFPSSLQIMVKVLAELQWRMFQEVN